MAAKSALSLPPIRLTSLLDRKTLSAVHGPPRAARRKGRRIAIVDDEEDLCAVFSMLLKNLGYRTEFVAHDGTEIVKAVMEGFIRPDLILMDYRMPMMNGLQAAESIRVFEPETKIIIVSADDSVKPQAVSAGLPFIQKPFSISCLHAAIEDCLNGSGDAGRSP